MNDLIHRFLSRKFLLALLAVIIALFNAKYLHLTPDQIDLIRDAIVAFIGMEGAADLITRYNANSSTEKSPTESEA